MTDGDAKKIIYGCLIAGVALASYRFYNYLFYKSTTDVQKVKSYKDGEEECSQKENFTPIEEKKILQLLEKILDIKLVNISMALQVIREDYDFQKQSFTTPDKRMVGMNSTDFKMGCKMIITFKFLKESKKI